jgi:hypothetical protein
MSIANYVPQQVLDHAATIAWATGLSAITPEALAVRNELEIAVAREHLDDAVRLEMMDKKSILVGYSPLYSVTEYGRKLARKHEDAGGYTYPLGLVKCRVTIKGVRHLIACASAAAALERRYPNHRVIGELELRKEEREQKCPLISVDIFSRSWRQFHSPDLVIWPPVTPGEPPPLPVGVEIELSLKSREELTNICRALARCRNIEAALYFVENAKIERKLFEVIEELKAEDKIVVNPLSDLVGSLPGFDLPQPLTDD